MVLYKLYGPDKQESDLNHCMLREDHTVVHEMLELGFEVKGELVPNLMQELFDMKQEYIEHGTSLLKKNII